MRGSKTSTGDVGRQLVGDRDGLRHQMADRHHRDVRTRPHHVVHAERERAEGGEVHVLAVRGGGGRGEDHEDHHRVVVPDRRVVVPDRRDERSWVGGPNDQPPAAM
ncbi:hypothetical protein [Streptomyces sp. NPDC005865]|uniref:hypothetical protein n=1 Tax=Streptomyces sp. NPDC005865 TaxID=3155453 RepID=UPI0033E58515